MAACARWGGRVASSNDFILRAGHGLANGTGDYFR